MKDLVNYLRDQFGEDSAFTLDDENIPQFTGLFVSTGSVAVDYVIGLPGLPFGRIVEVTGEVSTGKTFLGLTTLRNTINTGGIGVIIDFEHALDPKLAKLAKLDLSKCILLQPPSLEDAFQQFDAIVNYLKKEKTQKPVTIVLDSLAAAPTKAEVEAEFTDAVQVGHKAKFLSLALRKAAASICEMNILFIIINQLREKIGVVSGPSWTTPGGLAVPYHSSIRLLIQKRGDIKSYSTGEVKGISLRVLCMKNKLAPPLKVAYTDFIFDFGFDNAGTLAEILVEKGVLTKSSSTYSYKGTNFKATTLLKKINDLPSLKEEVQKCVPYLYQTYILQNGLDMESMMMDCQES